MKNSLKELALPPLNLVFSLKAFVCVVTYRNIGQMRFSAEPVAMCAEEAGTGERFFLLLGEEQKKLSPVEFEAFIKEKYPQYPLEIQIVDKTEPAIAAGEAKNGNITLDIQSGSSSQKTDFKPS